MRGSRPATCIPNKELKICGIRFTIFARSRGMFAPCKDKMRRIDRTMKKRTFETALARLEQIVTELEQDELELDAGLKKFDEGLQLVRFCSQKLNEADSRVELLLHKDSELAVASFATALQIKEDATE